MEESSGEFLKNILQFRLSFFISGKTDFAKIEPEMNWMGCISWPLGLNELPWGFSCFFDWAGFEFWLSLRGVEFVSETQEKITKSHKRKKNSGNHSIKSRKVVRNRRRRDIYNSNSIRGILDSRGIVSHHQTNFFLKMWATVPHLFTRGIPSIETQNPIFLTSFFSIHGRSTWVSQPFWLPHGTAGPFSRDRECLGPLPCS